MKICSQNCQDILNLCNIFEKFIKLYITILEIKNSKINILLKLISIWFLLINSNILY